MVIYPAVSSVIYPPSPVGLASTLKTTLAAVEEKSPGERSRPSTLASPVGLATPPRSTTAAVGETSQSGPSSGDVNHNTVEMKPNLAVKIEDMKPSVPMFRWHEPPKRVSICFCQTDIFRLTILIKYLYRFSTWKMQT